MQGTIKSKLKYTLLYKKVYRTTEKLSGITQKQQNNISTTDLSGRQHSLILF